MQCNTLWQENTDEIGGLKLALAIPEYQLGDVDRFLRQRRAAGKVITDRDYRAAYSQYWDAQLGRRMESQKLGLMQERVNLMGEQLDLQNKWQKQQLDTAAMKGYFEGLGTLFQGLFVGGYGRSKGWW